MIGRVRIRRRTWVVCRTESRRESWAAENVRRQGLNYYLPYYCEMKAGRRSPSLLFPGYLFVQPRNKQWTMLNSTYGMIDVVLMGKQPAWLEDSVVDALRQQEDESGLITLPPMPAPVHFTKGQKVKLRSGPFLGYIGIYEGTTRLARERVLLDLLGRVTPIEVGTAQIEDVVDEPIEDVDLEPASLKR